MNRFIDTAQRAKKTKARPRIVSDLKAHFSETWLPASMLVTGVVRMAPSHAIYYCSHDFIDEQNSPAGISALRLFASGEKIHRAV